MTFPNARAVESGLTGANGDSRLVAVAEFTWDVQVPGEDLPRRLTTDYLVSEGEEIVVDGREWLVERVEIIENDETDETASVATGIIAVVPPNELQLG